MNKLPLIPIFAMLAPMAFSQESSPVTPNKQGKINLVAVGEALYLQNCTICHENLSESDPKVIPKIGPSFFGILQKRPIQITVFSNETLTPTLTKIMVDDQYIRSSLLEPTLHMATKEESGKLVAYPPAMPRFPLSGTEFKGISAYLRTLNEKANQGPSELWVNAPKENLNIAKYELSVGSMPRIVRAEFEDVSTRAIAVGNPSGVHYIFDPAWLAIRKVWQGGFLNLKSERTNRSMGLNPLGQGAELINFGFAIRPLAGTTPVDLQYQSFPTDNQSTYATLQADFNSSTPYLDRIPKDIRYLGYHFGKDGNPEFHYQIGESDIRQKVELLSPRSMNLKFTFKGGTDPIRFKLDTDHVQLHTSIGQLDGDILSIPPGTENATLTLDLIKP